MPWKKTANVAQYGEGNWSGLVKTVPQCTPQAAQRIAYQDPSISFFFFCRQGMSLKNGSGSTRTFNPGDAVFFSGTPQYGTAPQCDSYEKFGTSIAYLGGLETPEHRLAATQYVTADGGNSIDVAIFCAANIVAKCPKDYVLLAPNPAGQALAVGASYYPQMLKSAVPAMQNMGITVLLSFQGYGHETVGWSNFNPDDTGAIDDFVAQLKSIVDHYGLDGIDIDDEYSGGSPNNHSLVAVTAAMKSAMPDLIISKALFQDRAYFAAGLASNLTYGWTMEYGETASASIPPYVGDNLLSYPQVAAGYDAQIPNSAQAEVSWLKNNGCLGYMVYNFQLHTGVMQKMVQAWCGAEYWNQKTSKTTRAEGKISNYVEV